jgi:hypothetical protein
MRTPRTLVPIPPQLVAEIDRIAGPRHRSKFIVEVLERELRRREQIAALHEAAGSWKDEDHPELGNGSETWIKEMRQESEARFRRLQQLQDSE